MTHHTPPSTSVDELRRLTALELSLPARLRYVGLLLAAATMTAIVTALLLTEPILPRRTSMALVVMAVMGLTWMGFAAWVLTYKRVLLGRQRIVAGRLAVSFSTTFFLGALLFGYTTSSAAALAAAGMGLLMIVIAAAMLMRARRTFQQLSKRRDELQRMLGGNRQ